MSKYYKRNYVDVLQKITPEYYKGLDKVLSEETLDIVDEILIKDIKLIELELYCGAVVAEPLKSILDYDTGTQVARGIIPYFVKGNNLTNLTLDELNLNLIQRLGYSIEGYTKDEFATFVSGTLIPKITLGSEAAPSDLYAATDGLLGDDNEASHRFMFEEFGLLYFLTYERTAVNFKPYLAELFVDKLYGGGTLTLADALKAIKKALFETGITSVVNNILPESLAVGTDTWTSGIQQFDKLATWVDILYNSDYEQNTDDYIENVLYDYFDNGVLPNTLNYQGPLYRLQRAVGFLISDINDQIVSLETLNSIDDCPESLLPYLADLVGWKLYTSKPDSWRRQLFNAVSLYHKKGTAQGLEDLIKVVLPSFDLDFSSSFNEFYESYIPNLIYYLLKTDSSVTSSLSGWTSDKAIDYTQGERDPQNLDTSIRYIIDHLMLRSVQSFPHLFSVRGYQFNLDDPHFLFNYRGRDFAVPPWEEENFYKDCAVSEDYLEFLRDELVCLGVSEKYAQNFYDYTLSNTADGKTDPIFYNNGFLFLTSGLNLPPNYSYLIDNYKREFFDYIPLWNGKSSHFNLTVSSTSIEDNFFNPGAFDRKDFFDSLEAIPSFTPAKAIARVHVDLQQGQPHISYVKLSPRLNVKMVSTPNLSSTLGGWHVSGLDMRSDKAGLVGRFKYPGYAFNTSSVRATNKAFHEYYSTFTKDRVYFGNKYNSKSSNFDLSSSPFTLSGDYISIDYGRGTKRRKGYHKVISEGDWFIRDGFNPPLWLNLGRYTDALSSIDFGLSGYLPLGLIPSSYQYQTIEDTFNLPGVYEYCEDTDSSAVFHGVPVSGTFETRGIDEIEIVDGNYYKFRDDLEDFQKIVYDFIQREIGMEAERFLLRNEHLFRLNSDWKAYKKSVENFLWSRYDLSKDSYYNFFLDKYEKRTGLLGGSLRGINYLYERDYAGSDNTDTSRDTVYDIGNGGGTIVSKIYGPFLYNGFLQVDGSGASDKIRYINSVSSINIRGAGKGLLPISQDTDLYIGGQGVEYRDPYYFSGVEIVTNQENSSKMYVFDLSADTETLPESSLLRNKNETLFRLDSQNNRLRYSFNYGDGDVSFEPEHNYTVNVSSLFMNINSFATGGKGYSIWIHTEPELDYEGNLVFWNYSPNGKWTKHLASSVTNSNGNKYVKGLIHNINHEPGALSNTNTCFASSDQKGLLNVSVDDIVKDTIAFSTKNRGINVDLPYYRSFQQVHRKDQKYVIEVFMYQDLNKDAVYAFDGLSVIDETIRERAQVEYNISIDDYKLEDITTTSIVRFFDEGGNLIPLGEDISVDLSGNMYYAGQKVTAAIALSRQTKTLIPKPLLYTQVEAVQEEVYYSNGNSSPSAIYGGVIRQTSYSNDYSIPSLRVYGKTRGSHILHTEKVRDLLDPIEFLEILRFYKQQSNNIKKRNNQRMDTDNGWGGGVRLNYRHIAHTNQWTSPVLADAQRYSKIDLLN